MTTKFIYVDRAPNESIMLQFVGDGTDFTKSSEMRIITVPINHLFEYYPDSSDNSSSAGSGPRNNTKTKKMIGSGYAATIDFFQGHEVSFVTSISSID